MIVSYSTDGENFHRLGKFKSYEAATFVLRKTIPLKIGDTAYLGEICDCTACEFAALVDADDVLELVGVRACDEVGEVAEGWPSLNKSPEIDSLNFGLRSVIAQYLRENDPPNFFRVVNIEKWQVANEFRMFSLESN